MENIVVLATVAIGFCLLVLIPIVVLMTEHQRKMAGLMRQPLDASESGQHALLDELRQLRIEVDTLKSMVADLRSSSQDARGEDIQERILPH